jgi:hypothetical protein
MRWPLIFLIAFAACSTNPTPAQHVWHYPPGLTEAQAAAVRADCMKSTAYEMNFAFRLIAIENCLYAQGWSKGPPSLAQPLPERKMREEVGLLPTLLQLYPRDWTAEEAERERMECYRRTLHETNSEVQTSILVKCLQVKGFTLIMAYYPSHLRIEQAAEQQSQCYERGIVDPNGLMVPTLITCLRGKGWNVGPRLQ